MTGPVHQEVIDLSGAFRLILDYGFFTVVTDQANVDPVATEFSELFELTPTSVRVCTGMAYGSFHLHIRAYGHGYVPLLRAEQWEAIGEAVVESPSGDIRLDDVQALDASELPANLATVGPGRYLLRLCARNRGLYSDLVGPSDPAEWERYLLQVWPTEAPVGLMSIKSDHVPKFAAQWMTVTKTGR